MRITGTTNPLSFNAAKAYGVKSAAAPPMAKSIGSITRSVPVDSFQPRQATQQLVAGIVSQPVNFDAASTARSLPAAALQMYTRAAEKMEATIAVHVGRTLDAKG